MNVLKGLTERARKRNAERRKKCYEEHGNGNGKCGGCVGGDRYTDYLSYSCINCKYLSLSTKS